METAKACLLPKIVAINKTNKSSDKATVVAPITDANGASIATSTAATITEMKYLSVSLIPIAESSIHLNFERVLLSLNPGAP